MITSPEAICTALTVYAKELSNERNVTANAQFTGSEWVVTFQNPERGFTGYTVMLSREGKLIGFDP